MNSFYPMYFYLIFCNIKKEYSLAILLFASLYLDFILYYLPGLHFLFSILFYGINQLFIRVRTLKMTLVVTSINTFLYLSLLSILFSRVSFFFFLSQLLWNNLFAYLFYTKERIMMKKISVLNK